MKKAAFLFLAGLFLASGAAAQDKAAPPDSSSEHVAELISKLDGSGMDERVRAKQAYEELAKIGPAAVPQLLNAVRSEKPWVRVWSAAALAGTHDARAVEPLLKLLDDPFVEVRMIACWHGAGLYDLDARIAPAIVRRLADEKSDVRKWAERGLTERIKFRGIEKELASMVRSDSAPGRTLAFKLVMLRDKQEPAAAIGKALTEEKDWRARSAAVRCLGEEVLPPEQAYFDLTFRAMSDESEEVRADGVEMADFALTKLAKGISAEVRDSVWARLKEKLPAFLDAKLPRLRGASLFLLAGGERKEMFDRALKAANDPSPEVRVYAARALGRCGVKSAEVSNKAVSLLEDKDAQVRRVAFGLLQWATGKRFEFKPDDPPDARAKAVLQIRAQLDRPDNPAR